MKEQMSRDDWKCFSVDFFPIVLFISLPFLLLNFIEAEGYDLFLSKSHLTLLPSDFYLFIFLPNSFPVVGTCERVTYY